MLNSAPQTAVLQGDAEGGPDKVIVLNLALCMKVGTQRCTATWRRPLRADAADWRVR